MERITEFTHLGRALDPRVPSNLFAVIAAAVMGGIGLLAGGFSGTDTRGGAISVGLSTFLTWAVGRELDPDRSITANVAAILGGLVALGFPGAVPGALYLVLVTARIVVRTTGLAPKWSDLAVHVVIAGVLARTGAGWVAAMGLALAVVRDIALPPAAPRLHLWWGAGIAAAATAGLTVTDALGDWSTPSAPLSAIITGGVLGAAFLMGPETPESTADFTGEALNPRRLQEGRVLAVVIAAAAAIVGGADGILALAPLWATLAVAGAIRLLTHTR